MAGRLISRCNRETSIRAPLLLADTGSLGVDASAINMKAACRIVALIHPTIHSLHRRYPTVIRDGRVGRDSSSVARLSRTELGSNGTSASPIVDLRASSQHPRPGRYKSLISRTGRSSKTEPRPSHRVSVRIYASLLFLNLPSPPLLLLSLLLSPTFRPCFDLYSIVRACICVCVLPFVRVQSLLLVSLPSLRP